MIAEVAAMTAVGFGFYVSGRLLWRGLKLMVEKPNAVETEVSEHENQ